MVKQIRRGKQLDRHFVEQLKETVRMSHPHLLRVRHLYLTNTHLVVIMNPAATTLHSLALCASALHAANSSTPAWWSS